MGSTTLLGFTHVVKQLSSSLFFFNSNILFWLNFRVIFWLHGALKSFFGVGVGFDNCLGSTHIVEQLSFSMFLSILTFDFWGPFLLFGALFGYFWGWGRIQNCFGVYSCSWITFIFYVVVNFNILFFLNLG